MSELFQGANEILSEVFESNDEHLARLPSISAIQNEAVCFATTMRSGHHRKCRPFRGQRVFRRRSKPALNAMKRSTLDVGRLASPNRRCLILIGDYRSDKLDAIAEHHDQFRFRIYVRDGANEWCIVIGQIAEQAGGLYSLSFSPEYFFCRVAAVIRVQILQRKKLATCSPGSSRWRNFPSCRHVTPGSLFDQFASNIVPERPVEVPKNSLDLTSGR